MFRFLARKAGIWFAERQATGAPTRQASVPQEGAISKSLPDNLKTIRDRMGMSNDVVIRELVIRSAGSIRGALVYIDGMIHAKILNDNVISPLIHCECRIDMRKTAPTHSAISAD
jgi:hypothetical protein